MNRGRLAIFSPDGPIDNYFITNTTVAIGRSSGNDLVIDRHGISRYHASITLEQNTVELMDLDSVNGTYVDGLRLNPRQPRVLRGGEEVQIGDTRLVYYPPTDSHFEETVAVRTQSIEVAHVSVELEGPHIPVTPGTHAPATLHITNTGKEDLKIVLSSEGLPTSWARFDRTTFTLDPGEDIDVGITFKPVRRPESKPGIYGVQIQVSFPNTTYTPVVLKTNVEILGYNGFGVVLGTPLLNNGESFQLYIHNQGNTPLPLRFSGRDAGNRLIYHFLPETITLGAGERSVVTGTVKTAYRPIMGTTAVYEFALLTHSLTPSAFMAPISGQLRVEPRIPAWGAGILLLLPVLIIGLLLGITTSSSNDEDATAQNAPIVTRFVVNGSAAPLSTNIDHPLLVEWNVSNAEYVDLHVQHQETESRQQFRLPANQRQPHAIYVNDTGQYTLQLRAKNASQTQSFVPVSVTVRPTVRLSAMARSVDDAPGFRPVLYRNVAEQEIRLGWQTFWGLTTFPLTLRIEHPSIDGLNTRVDVGFATEHTLRLTENSTPYDTTPIRFALLYANQVAASVVLPVEYPTCYIMRDLTVYTTQDRQQRLATLDTTAIVKPDGRSPGNWIRIVLPTDSQALGYYAWVSPEDAPMLQCNITLNRLGLVQN